MKLSIVIPVYNEEQTISAVIERVLAVNLGDIDREIIIANDGSTDATRRLIGENQWAEDGRVRIYDNPINLGKGAAVRLGMKFATGDVLLIQDADLELDPQEYASLLAPIINGESDVVYGSRFLAGNNRVPFKTKVANRFLTMVTNLLFGGRLSDMETAYKVVRREVIAGLRLRCVGFDFEPELTARLLRAGVRIVEVPIAYNPRRADEGKKLRWIDGVDALYALFRCRFTAG